MKKHPSCLPLVLITLSFLVLLFLLLSITAPMAAEYLFGPPSQALTETQKLILSLKLLTNTTNLMVPANTEGVEQPFSINEGEDANSISTHLEQAGLIRDAEAFRNYLAWTGMDAYLQIGTYHLGPALPAQAIANMLVTSSLTDVTFDVLAGWRMEEIAEALPASGLSITQEDFIIAVKTPSNPPASFNVGISAEGYLFPGEYLVKRTISADALVSVLLQGFFSNLPVDYLEGYTRNGVNLNQAVTLASIVEREAVVVDEMPMIASVFYNRLDAGMRLETDPTVQYALGYNLERGTWWTTPLTTLDLQIDSPYNTYLYAGLPPGPISNPGLAALYAVAYPADSDYYFFQARCDDSGLHIFEKTFEEHEQNYCP